MKIIATSPIDLEFPIAIYEAALYSGKSSLQFFNKTKKGIDFILPDVNIKNKKTLVQRIMGDFKYNSNGIDWMNSAITGVTQYNQYSNSNKPQVQWKASGFRITGRDLIPVVKEYKKWYSTPEDYDKYLKALKGTQVILEKVLFSGNDIITGSNGIDTLIGGDGNDKITGRKGGDILVGGGGADLFIYKSVDDSPAGFGADTIKDFTGAKGDKIDLRKIDGNPQIKGRQPLEFIGTNQFSGSVGEVRFEFEKLQVFVGTNDPLMQINLPGVTSFKPEFLML